MHLLHLHFRLKHTVEENPWQSLAIFVVYEKNPEKLFTYKVCYFSKQK